MRKLNLLPAIFERLPITIICNQGLRKETGFLWKIVALKLEIYAETRFLGVSMQNRRFGTRDLRRNKGDMSLVRQFRKKEKGKRKSRILI